MGSIIIKFCCPEKPLIKKEKSQRLSQVPKLTFTPNTPNWPEAYEKIRVLGKGGFAVVYLVKDIIDKNHYALKVINKSTLSKSKD